MSAPGCWKSACTRGVGRPKCETQRHARVIGKACEAWAADMREAAAHARRPGKDGGRRAGGSSTCTQAWERRRQTCRREPHMRAGLGKTAAECVAKAVAWERRGQELRGR
eukprot:363609-Chlamydomonas_euryale.AAC.22